MRYAEKAYNAFMYPLESLVLSRRRREIIPEARGRMLEIGVGTGVNFGFYDWDEIDRIDLLDTGIAESLYAYTPPREVPLDLHDGSVENLPFEDRQFDTVVATLLFCSVTNQLPGLSEIRRVLKPDGRYIFIEHIRPQRSASLGVFFDMVNPVWHALSGDCNLNRNTLDTIEAAGFEIDLKEDGPPGVFVHGSARLSS